MPEDDDYVEVSRLQIPNPELGPLEQRVEATYESATLSDSISIEDTEYWFNTPEGTYADSTLHPVTPSNGSVPVFAGSMHISGHHLSDLRIWRGIIAVAAVPSCALWANTSASHTGGWNIEPERVAKAKETTTEIPTAHNPGDGRVSPGLEA